MTLRRACRWLCRCTGIHESVHQPGLYTGEQHSGRREKRQGPSCRFRDSRVLHFLQSSSLQEAHKSIVRLVHGEDRVKLTREKFKENGSNILVDMTRLQSRKSFLQVKALMTMSKKLNQVRHLHELQRDITVLTRLEAVIGGRQPLQSHCDVQKGFFGYKGRKSSICDKMSSSGACT